MADFMWLLIMSAMYGTPVRLCNLTHSGVVAASVGTISAVVVLSVSGSAVSPAVTVNCCPTVCEEVRSVE